MGNIQEGSKQMNIFLDSPFTELSGPNKGQILRPYQGLYLEYRNNFLSVEGFAAYHNIPVQAAVRIINKGRASHNDAFGHH